MMKPGYASAVRPNLSRKDVRREDRQKCKELGIGIAEKRREVDQIWAALIVDYAALNALLSSFDANERSMDQFKKEALEAIREAGSLRRRRGNVSTLIRLAQKVVKAVGRLIDARAITASEQRQLSQHRHRIEALRSTLAQLKNEESSLSSVFDRLGCDVSFISG